MRQQNRKAERNYQPTLRVIKGHKQQQTDLAELVNTAWTFAYSSLWNCSLFSTKEIDAAKENIAVYLKLSNTPRTALLSFCQRVLLARYYLNNGTSRYIPLPSVWLDRSNEKGFAGTRQWYNEIKAVRESLPHYKAEIKALAEAVLEFSEEPTRQNFYYWKNYFIEKQTPGLLTLLQVYASNHLFTI
jgi:hypothetical protein